MKKFLTLLLLALSLSSGFAQSYPIITAGGGIQEWQTATNYVLDDIVWESEDFYKALTIHTSGVFATDLANMEWVRMSDDINFISASTDGGIVRWDGITGDAIQDSNIVIDDLDNITNATSLHIGGTSISISSLLDVDSTIKGTRPFPRMSTAQRDAIVSPVIGLTIYDTDREKISFYDGVGWISAGSGIDAWQPAYDYKVGDIIYNGGDAAEPIYRVTANFTSGGVFGLANLSELAQHINVLPTGTATDTALIRWNGTGGQDVQNSGLLVDASDNLTGMADLSLSGTITYSSPTPSLPLKLNAANEIISEAIDIATETTGILPADNGGTGLDASAAPNGTFLIGNGTGFDLNVISGTPNQVITTPSSGGFTLGLPQDIATTSAPTFASATFTDLLPNYIMITDGASGVSATATINLATQVSGTLPAANGGSIYDNFVGTGGFDDVDSAVTSSTAGDSIGYLSEIKPAVAASQTVTKTLGFTGGGNGSTINGSIQFSTGSDGSSLNNLKIDGNITIDAGVKNLILTNIWLTAGSVVVDNSGNTSNMIIVVIEE